MFRYVTHYYYLLWCAGVGATSRSAVFCGAQAVIAATAFSAVVFVETVIAAARCGDRGHCAVGIGAQEEFVQPYCTGNSTLSLLSDIPETAMVAMVPTSKGYLLQQRPPTAVPAALEKNSNLPHRPRPDSSCELRAVAVSRRSGGEHRCSPRKRRPHCLLAIGENNEHTRCFIVLGLNRCAHPL